MANKASLKMRVVQTYRAAHRYMLPNYDISKCGMNRVESEDGLTEAFVFSHQALKLGDKVAVADLEQLPIGGSYKFYLLKDFSSASQASNSTAPASGKKEYVPDTFKSPEDIWRITKGLC